jgi:hypothetical protein
MRASPLFHSRLFVFHSRPHSGKQDLGVMIEHPQVAQTF